MKVKLLNHLAKTPTRSTDGSAGYDISAVDCDTVMPGMRAVVKTGVSIAIPEGRVAIIKPRSGLAMRYGIDVLAGVIDSDYRGEIQVVLVNHGSVPFVFTTGDRIAQMVIVDHETAAFEVVDELPETVRGNGGFGSTGQ